MITALTVSNYKSLGEDVRIDFGKLTVLVGQNSAGKSNILDALQFITDALQIGLPAAIGARPPVRRWTHGHPHTIRIGLELVLPSGPARYAFALRGRAAEYEVEREVAEIHQGSETLRFLVERGVWKEGPVGVQPPLDPTNLALQLLGGDARFHPLVRAIRGIALYTIDPDVLRAPQKHSAAKPLHRRGDNLLAILVAQPEVTWKAEMMAALHKLTGDVLDIRIRDTGGYLVAEFGHAPSAPAEKWLSSAMESDGTLRVAGLLAALLQEPEVPVICIEEPELTVHPGAIPLLYDYLMQATQRSQVIVTTHSPELLDMVRPEDVRVVTRSSEGVTRVAPLAANQHALVKQRLMSLGEIMRAPGLEPAEMLPAAE